MQRARGSPEVRPDLSDESLLSVVEEEELEHDAQPEVQHHHCPNQPDGPATGFRREAVRV